MDKCECCESRKNILKWNMDLTKYLSSTNKQPISSEDPNRETFRDYSREAK